MVRSILAFSPEMATPWALHSFDVDDLIHAAVAVSDGPAFSVAPAIVGALLLAEKSL